jgi:hypothetical protein
MHGRAMLLTESTTKHASSHKRRVMLNTSSLALVMT